MQHAETTASWDTVFSRLNEIETAFDEVAGATAPALPKECYTAPEFFEFERKAVFARCWVCVGREEQVATVGDHIAVTVAGEPLLGVRNQEGVVHAMSAVCQHRGQVLTTESGKGGHAFRCPLHFWRYDLNGKLLGAPYMGPPEVLACLRKTTKLPSVSLELWHGFIFVNLDPQAQPLAPTLAKVEPFWDNYRDAGLIAVPPMQADKPLPWNWKIHVENFTDAYHPGFVHKGTHDVAPSVHPDGGVQFVSMEKDDNAIIRSVPLLIKDAGMMSDGWGERAMFPPIDPLSDAQRSRLTFILLPPSMTLVFAPGAVAYTLLSATGVIATFASSDRVTGGGWLLPQSTLDLPDFAEQAKVVREGASKIWAQDVPINLAMQAGKNSRFQPPGAYGALEKTLIQFNAWLLRTYKSALTDPGT